MKTRIYECCGKKCEIIGASNKCSILIDGASHPTFSNVFTSIRAARIRFLQWARNVSG